MQSFHSSWASQAICLRNREHSDDGPDKHMPCRVCLEAANFRPSGGNRLAGYFLRPASGVSAKDTLNLSLFPGGYTSVYKYVQIIKSTCTDHQINMLRAAGPGRRSCVWEQHRSHLEPDKSKWFSMQRSLRSLTVSAPHRTPRPNARRRFLSFQRFVVTAWMLRPVRRAISTWLTFRTTPTHPRSRRAIRDRAVGAAKHDRPASLATGSFFERTLTVWPIPS